MKRSIVTTILVLIALSLIAQPAFAGGTTLQADPMPNGISQIFINGGTTPPSCDGQDKIVSWYGIQVIYLSRSTCMWIGTGVSASAITAFLVALSFGPPGATIAAIGLGLAGLGAAFFTAAGTNRYGIKIYCISGFWIFPQSGC